MKNFIERLFKRNYAVANAFVSKMGQPVYTSWKLENAVAKGYKVNSWVYRSVYLIAKAVSQVGWVVSKDGEFIPDHHLSKLFKKPHPHLSRQDLFELTSSWLELAGNSYQKKVKAGGVTTELWPISPDRLAPVPSKNVDEWMKGYSLDGGKTIKYTMDEIVHHKFFNPANPLLGIAPLEAAARSVDVDNDQIDWNKSAMQNRGVVDGVMSFKRDFQTQDDVDKVAERLNQSMTGVKNARRIKVVGSNATYKRMALTPAEMDFINSRKFNREEIFIVFGIPPVYAGVQDSATFNNYQTSELIFWFQTIIPLLDDIKDTYNNSFDDELQDNESLVYDLTKVRAIRRAMLEWTKTAVMLHEMGVPFEQLNKVFEFGFEAFPGWELSIPREAKPEPGAAQGTTRAKKEFRARVLDIEKEVDKTAEEKKPLLEGLLQKQQKAVFKALEKSRGADIKAIINRDKNLWISTLTEVYVDVAVEYAENTIVKEKREISPIEAIIENYISGEAMVLKEISQIFMTTVDKILLNVGNAADMGQTMNELQLSIIDSGIFDEKRALMLARTISGTAVNLGQYHGAIASGATHKKWTTASSDVRKSHQKLDNKSIPVDDYFSVGGEKALFPLDNRLTPKERVNCRCTLTYEIK